MEVGVLWWQPPQNQLSGEVGTSAGGEDVRIMTAADESQTVAVVSGPVGTSQTGGRRIAFRLTLNSPKETK